MIAMVLSGTAVRASPHLPGAELETSGEVGMPTLIELARMCRAVYDPQPSVANWSCTRVTATSGMLDGFRAAAFVRGRELVVAFRGTAQAIDAVADLKLGTGMNSSYFAAGETFAGNFQDFADVTVTGHSLGGAIAQVVANRREIPMATFNAPGVAVLASRNLADASLSMQVVRTAGMLVSVVRHPVQAGRDVFAAFNSVRGVNLCLANDPVSKIGNHYGKVMRIPGTGVNPLTQHGIDTVISVLEKPENFSIARCTPLTA